MARRSSPYSEMTALSIKYEVYVILCLSSSRNYLTKTTISPIETIARHWSEPRSIPFSYISDI